MLPASTPLLRAAAEAYALHVRSALGDNVVSIVLFGSVARAEAVADSDVDLLIVAEVLPPGRFARLALLTNVDREFEAELERLRGLGLQPRLARIMKTREEAGRLVPLYLDLVEDARLLHDRDGFFGSVLARLRASMTRLGSERRQQGQPDLARRIHAEAGRHHQDEAWHLVVRRCQEAVELGLKAALRGPGLEVPLWPRDMTGGVM